MEEKRTFEVFQETLAAYISANPKYYGIYLPSILIAPSRAEQVKTAAGFARAELSALRPPSNGGGLPFVEILVDASLGAFHADAWLPVARDLAWRGARVGFTTNQPHLDEEVRARVTACDLGALPVLGVPVNTPCGLRRRAGSKGVRRASVPAKGLLRLALVTMQRAIDRLTERWEVLLAPMGVRAVVSTSPLGLWTSTLFLAARRLGISTVLVQQGLPNGSLYRNTTCDCAVVWSGLGERMLRQCGWAESHIAIAVNPMLPSEEERRLLRERRRAELNLGAEEPVVLFLGGKSVDRTLAWETYPGMCRAFAEGVSRTPGARRPRVLFRQHPTELAPETERILRASGVDPMVSRGASLVEDIAAADVALSTGSTALETAYLMGLPIADVNVAEIPFGEADFRWIGAPLLVTAEEVAGFLSGDYRAVPTAPLPPRRSAAEEILELVSPPSFPGSQGMRGGGVRGRGE